VIYYQRGEELKENAFLNGFKHIFSTTATPQAEFFCRINPDKKNRNQSCFLKIDSREK
jgi:hypothetical protein